MQTFPVFPFHQILKTVGEAVSCDDEVVNRVFIHHVRLPQWIEVPEIIRVGQGAAEIHNLIWQAFMCRPSFSLFHLRKGDGQSWYEI